MRIAPVIFAAAVLAAGPAFAQGSINGDGQRSGSSGSEAGGKGGAAGQVKPNVEGSGNGAGRAGSLDQNPGKVGTGAAAPMGAGTEKPK